MYIVFCGTGLNFSHRSLSSRLRSECSVGVQCGGLKGVMLANSGNACKRRKHIALDPKQKCILMTSQDKRKNNTKRESSVYYVLDYENETKRTWNTMVETTVLSIQMAFDFRSHSVLGSV